MSEFHLADRRTKAGKIIEQPTHFKVCEGCGSIVASRTVACPSCHSYRFDSSVETVTATARELADRPQQGVTASDFF